MMIDHVVIGDRLVGSLFRQTVYLSHSGSAPIHHQHRCSTVTFSMMCISSFLHRTIPNNTILSTSFLFAGFNCGHQIVDPIVLSALFWPYGCIPLPWIVGRGFRRSTKIGKGPLNFPPQTTFDIFESLGGILSPFQGLDAGVLFHRPHGGSGNLRNRNHPSQRSDQPQQSPPAAFSYAEFVA